MKQVELRLYSWIANQVDYVLHEPTPVNPNYTGVHKTKFYIKNYPGLLAGQRMLHLGGRLFAQFKGYTREVWLKIE